MFEKGRGRHMLNLRFPPIPYKQQTSTEFILIFSKATNQQLTGGVNLMDNRTLKGVRSDQLHQIIPPATASQEGTSHNQAGHGRMAGEDEDKGPFALKT